MHEFLFEWSRWQSQANEHFDQKSPKEYLQSQFDSCESACMKSGEAVIQTKCLASCKTAKNQADKLMYQK